MKDQIRLLRNCIHKDIPAVVFQGDDSCVEEILMAAKEIYQKHGCSKEFLYDWQLLIEEVKAKSSYGASTKAILNRNGTDSRRNDEEGSDVSLLSS